MKDQFRIHIKQKLKTFQDLLETFSLDGFVIPAGHQRLYFRDDCDVPFTPNPYFSMVCPLRDHGHVLVVSKTEGFKLIAYQPEDFWHELECWGQDDFWASAFEIQVVKTLAERKEKLPSLGPKWVLLGEETEFLKDQNMTVNPEFLFSYLDYDRAQKTEYEILCLEKATEIAARGHKQALQTFLAGGTEVEVYCDFQKGCRVGNDRFGYVPIVGMDEKAAVLHYRGRRPDAVGQVCLIDAGVSYHGYNSDITRTHLKPDVMPEFTELYKKMQELQAKLCSMVKVGVSLTELFLESQSLIAQAMIDVGIAVKTSASEIVEKKWIKTFYPHGLGHMLGLQVHDVGGHLQNAQGDVVASQDRYLRLSRKLRENEVITIEPGVYFIEMLLTKLKESNHAKFFDWELIDKMKSCGGIRIEDNIVVSLIQSRNLTREHLPE